MTAIPENEDRPPVEVTFVENVHAPEVYADSAAFFFAKNGNIAITFDSGRLDASNPGTSPYPIRRVVVGRLVMPASGAQSLAVGLYDFLVSQGLGPPRPENAN